MMQNTYQMCIDWLQKTYRWKDIHFKALFLQEITFICI